MSKDKAEERSDCARCGSYVCYSPNYMDAPAKRHAALSYICC